MYISELKLWNFRKYGNVNSLHGININKPDLTVNFSPRLNVLIGENDSGKTAIIDALKHILNTKSLDFIRLEDKDFFEDRNTGIRATELRIECKFSDISDPEAGSFLEWIGIDNKGNYDLRIWLNSSRKDQNIITNIKAGQDDEGIQLDGDARENLKVTYLKPLRDALSELTPGYKSRLAQILKGHEIFKDAKDENGNRIKHILEEKANKANHEITGFFDINGDESNPEKQGSKITKDIKRLLDDFSFEGINNNPVITLTDSELSELLKSLKLVSDSNKAGLGSLNKLYMAAEFLLLNQSNGRNLKLALIEEIEAHLHPQAQLKIMEELKNESSFDGQIILTTHSTTLASKVNLNNLILCKDYDVFPMFKGRSGLDESDYEFLERFLDDTKANLFFARGVILVEGDAENLLLPTIAELLNRPLHKHGISIVNIGSTAFMRYAKIFHRTDGKILDLPVSCITDLDIAQTLKGDIVTTKMRRIGNEPKYLPDITTERVKKSASLEREQSRVKVFTSPLWTLEFDLLNSLNKTRELLLTAILEAQLLSNRTNYKGLSTSDCKRKQEDALNKLHMLEGNPKEWIAYKLYSMYLANERVSKAVTAQRFAKLLRDNDKEAVPILKSAPEFEYIRNAIVHVTQKPLT
jgi:putative ATP-dependent endonuclease of the OLD family